MNKTLTAKTAVLGALVAVATGIMAPATASAYYGDSGCPGGYWAAGLHAQNGVQDVCAVPSVVDGFGFVNPIAAQSPPWALPPGSNPRLDASLNAVCSLYFQNTYDEREGCAIPWVPRMV